MSTLQHVGVIFIALGTIFYIGSMVGLTKASNAYTIMHIGSVNDAISCATSLLGVAILLFCEQRTMMGVKVCLLICGVYIMNPISSYVLSKVLYFQENEVLDKVGK